ADAVLLTLLNGLLIIGAFALILFGDTAHGWVNDHVSSGWIVGAAFEAARWVIILAAMSLSFALTYYIGPDVEQRFRFITPGSVVGVAVLVLASIGFKVYVSNFGKYDATYGSIG